MTEDWYLIRTKPARERWVQDQLSIILPQVFLPMLETRMARFGRRVWCVVPMFPSYLFARFDLRERYFDVKYLAGVYGIVSAGLDPLTVPEGVIEGIRGRGVNGVVRVEPEGFTAGELVRVIEGPFQGLEAVFERYLSGTERVAILLSTVEARGLRVKLAAAALVR